MPNPFRHNNNNHIQSYGYKYIFVEVTYTAAETLSPLPDPVATVDLTKPFSFLSSTVICCCLHSKLQNALSPLLKN